VGYLICLPNGYHDITFPDKEITSYTQVPPTSPQPVTFQLPQILEEQILIEALRTEENPKNLQLLLWTIITYIYDNIDMESNFPNVIIGIILSHVVGADPWPSDVTMTSLHVFKELSHLYAEYNKGKVGFFFKLNLFF
jgi:hypothetical protein